MSATDVIVDPLSSDILYAFSTTAGFYRSANRGETWAPGGVGLPRTFLLTLQTEPFGAAAGEFTRLIAGANGSGVFESTDGGANWISSSAGMRGADINDVAVDPSNGQIAYAATDGGGMFKTTDGGATWSEAHNNLQHQEPGVLVIDPANPSTIYVGSVDPSDRTNGALSRTTDGAETWNVLQGGAPIFALATHPSDGQTLWIGSNTGFYGTASGLYLSRSGGAGFTQIYGDNGILSGQEIRGIAVDPQNPRNVYVLGADLYGGYYFFWSDDEGAEFRATISTATPLLGIAVDPSNSKRVFVTSFGAGLLRSTDGGQAQFQQVNDGLPSTDSLTDVFSLAFDPRNSATMLVATGLGVYRSDNGGDAWSPANTGLENVAIRRIVIGPNGEAYAAAVDAGVWVSTDLGESWHPTARAALETAGLTHAASFRAGAVASEQIASLFGGPFTDRTEAAQSIPLPTSLAGVSLTVTDSQGVTRDAPLFFASQGQINFQVPEGTALGTATVNVRTAQAEGLSIQIEVVKTAPGLFAAAGTGEGPAAANSQLYSNGAGGPVTPVYSVSDGAIQLTPLDLGGDGDQLVLILYGSGIRNYGGSIQATIDGVEASVIGVAPQGQFVGLDQVNILVPRSLLGAGVVEVRLTVDGVSTNVVTVRVE